jgi:hypothetical protein
LLNNELIQQLNESAFAIATFTQLQKDFDRVGIALTFSDEVLQDAGSFSTFLSSEIAVIMDQAPHLLSQLFYIADLPESQVNQLLNESEHPQLALSEALLRRTAQKVIYRKKYKLGEL